MFRLLGHVLPNNKSVGIALTYIYGIGNTTSKEVLDKVEIDFEAKIKDLSEEDRKKITDVVREMELENDLRREVSTSIKRLKEIRCRRGMKHNMWMPVRGQKTRNNARTAKKMLGRARVRPVLKK